MEDGSICPLILAQTAAAPWWLSALVILILILINGFFSAAEMAIVTLNDKRVRKEAQEGNRQAKRLLRFIDHQASFLSMIQISITLAGFLSAAFGADRFAGALYQILDPQGQRLWLANVATVLVTVLISFFSLVLGELVPKRIGLGKAEAYAKHSALILLFFDHLFRPVSRFLNTVSSWIARAIGLSELEASERVTEEEIRLMTEASRESGDIHSDEADMINNIFELDDTEVSEIMTPRTAMVCLPLDASLDEVMTVAAGDRYSRIPVYGEDIDDIVGILHIKDLLRVCQGQDPQAKFKLADIVRPAYYVPGSKSVNVLFREMRQRRISLAVVIDEYGGTDGVIAMEDVLEEIVGEIEDEYDEQVKACQRREDGTYVLDGLLSPEEAGHYVPELQLMEEDDAYDTLAGFVLSLLGRIPEQGEQPSVCFENLKFTVLEMDDHRIARIQLEIMPKPDELGPKRN